MYNKFKYIVGEVRTSAMPLHAAVVFPEVIGHSDMAQVFVNIQSAGFGVVNDDLTVSVYGESVSLGKCAVQGDIVFVSRALALPLTLS